ncbi:LuxR family transcriptional regulator [Streptomyces sp. NPDC094466]|uniref:helix-turn-helix transcriptional regulator n=1 Tax=Streptomyces sp. NPDC094466 TaxID=3366065 RepID=UPI003829E63B
MTGVRAVERDRWAAGRGDHTEPAPEPELFRRLPRAEDVERRLAELNRGVRMEWLTVSRGDAPLQGPGGPGASLEEGALRRGAALRAVYRESVRADPRAVRHARELGELGGRTRTTSGAPLPMVIVDRCSALVPLDPLRPHLGALEVCDPAMVAVVQQTFEQVWTAAAVWDCAAPRSGRDERERRDDALLDLLCGGHTDESISRRLGVSLRTERRLVADLMVRLGARSRFEAGVQAVRSGRL